jgi:hypothetical protein
MMCSENGEGGFGGVAVIWTPMTSAIMKGSFRSDKRTETNKRANYAIYVTDKCSK